MKHIGDFSVLVQSILPPSDVQSHCLPEKSSYKTIGLLHSIFNTWPFSKAFVKLFVTFVAVCPSTCDQHLVPSSHVA